MSKVIGGNTGNGRAKVISGGTGNSGSKPKEPEYTSKSSSNSNDIDCFVATAAFGTPLQYEIQILRDWRDNTLRYTRAGRKFITTYYKVGPIVANFIYKYPAFKAPVRGVVKAIIRFMK